MAEIQIPKNILNPQGGELNRDQIITPEQKKAEELFSIIREKSSTNSQFQQLLDILKGDMLNGLISPKSQDIQDFLANPSMFEHNPSQYKKLFILLNIDLKAETITQLRTISQKIHAYYSSYSRDKTIRDTLDVSLAAKEKVASADTKVASSDGKMIEQRTSIEKITSAIPRSWNSRLEKYISGNIGNSEFFKKETYSNPQLKAETEDEKILYLQTIFFIDHQEEIRADMQKSLESAPPSEKEKIQENINSFEKYISVLNGLNISRPVGNLDKVLSDNFPPTRATETARIQAEKLEKTHDVYRDGTSLYFVNKSDPKDIRKIEIYADRAVLTVMQGGLSLSRDMTLLSHEETEERKEIRKAEGISGEKSRETETVGGVFFQMRGGEYATIPGGSRSTVDILRSRPSRSIQEQYESYEELLATKSPEELRKESDSSRQSRGAIIERMLDLSRQLFADNQQYFAPGAFGEEKLLNEADQVKSKLDTRISGLKVYKSSIDTAEKVSNDLSKLKSAFSPGDKIDTSVWEGRARAYLKEAVSDNIGLDGFSDSQFQQLLYQLEQKDSSGGVWKGGIELGTDTVRRDHQLRELEDIARKIQVDGSMRTGWQGLGRKIDQEGTPENIAWKGNKEQFGNWYKSIMTPSEAR